jgi:hypothetical protein
MKNRMGFVSNSSSASFIIRYEHLNKLQIYAICNHMDVARALYKDYIDDLYSLCDSDRWKVVACDDYIYGSTSMTNFSMRNFLKLIGVDEDHVEWGDD